MNDGFSLPTPKNSPSPPVESQIKVVGIRAWFPSKIVLGILSLVVLILTAAMGVQSRAILALAEESEMHKAEEKKLQDALKKLWIRDAKRQGELMLLTQMSASEQTQLKRIKQEIWEDILLPSRDGLPLGKFHVCIKCHNGRDAANRLEK
jgi:hypothetical protein